MKVLAAIFCSPAYFAMSNRWMAFSISLAFYLLAILLVITLIAAPVGFAIWMFGVMHAMWYYRQEMATSMMHENAEIIANKMAEKTNADRLAAQKMQETAAAMAAKMNAERTATERRVN
jgi:hypothetical protein